MVAKQIRISADLSMPLDAATETFGIFGVKGRGKTHTAAVLTEQFLGAGVPVVVIDPTGAHWGLRSSADGKRAGFPITIVGGNHADVPLEETAGSLLAELVASKRVPLLLDVSRLSKRAMRRFLTDFMETLYLANTYPLHIIADECDLYAPQRVYAGVERLLGAMEDVVRRGRIRGLGITLISQRPASVNTNVRSQVGTLILLGLTGTHDIKAVDEWVNLHADPETARKVKASLPALETGRAWVWSPQWLRILQQVQVDRRTTFDSSATPKVGETLIPPAEWAKVDAAALSAEIAATVERAKENDPEALRKRIAELERALEQAERACPEPARVEVPVVTEEMRAALARAGADMIAGLNASVEQLEVTLQPILEELERANLELPAIPAPVQPRLNEAPLPERARGSAPARPAKPVESSATEGPRERPATAREAKTVDTSIKIGKGERKVLEVLAQWPDGRAHSDLAFLAGYSPKASTLGVILAKLRRAGYVADGRPIRPTQAGLAAVGGAVRLPSGAELFEYWRHHPRMGEGERKVLDVLIDAYPAALSNEELCYRAGYSATASTVGVILSKLRKLGLVEKGARRTDSHFMASIAP
ncbi:ATP-binding protein [Kribbella sp. NPDC059898]|uniref:ATP-binding protein n=1 Tax=Kribbella sp. NPDC059898 TaxID=3346995 RepID=UPI003659530C